MSAATVERLPRTKRGAPRLRRVDDVLRYWAERIALVAPEPDSFEHGSLICRSDSIYHYGSHFELARILRDKRGRARLALLNGDNYGGSGGWGPSTSSRQGDVRHAVSETNVESLVVPFSALAGARIDPNTIMPVHIRQDRQTIEEHHSRTRPAKLAKIPDPSGAMTTETYMGYDDNTYRELTREVPVYVKDPNQTVPFSAEHGWSDIGATRGEDGIWRWHVRRHWLGDSVFRARTTEQRTRRATADELADHELASAWDAETRRLRNGTERIRRLQWERSRAGARDYGRTLRLAFAAEGFDQALNEHYDRPIPRSHVRDGRVLIEVTRWATFLSSFDYQESRPLYFLCELPYGAKPNTVDEAVEALKPPEVVAALARGLQVIRQGDLFAIPTKLTKRQIRRLRGQQDFTKRLRVLGTNHSVTEGIVCKGGAVLGRGIMRHEPEAWRPPDHASQKLGDAWHLLVRNTVPRTK